MHWVDRGPEPDGLESIRLRCTPRWVAYYPDKTGSKPSDSRWRDFHDDLREVFFDLCAYCEETCKGEEEHFRPKSVFPVRVYEWSNWVFACHDCNHAKSDKWPPGGYVDPCAKTSLAHPENYFTYDTETGEFAPKDGLSEGRRAKAIRMIADLKFNEFHHLKKRFTRLLLVSLALSNLPDDNADETTIVELVTRRSVELSSITCVNLAELGYSLDAD